MLDEKQAKKAIKALFKDRENQSGEDDLLESQPNLWVQIGINTSEHKKSLIEKRLPLKYPILSDSDNICLIVNNNVNVKELEQKLKDANVRQIAKVVTLKELEEHYSTFERMRNLAHSYSLFLVDSIVYNRMPKVLGGVFIKMKKFPVKIKLFGDLKAKVDQVLHSAYFRHSGGCIYSIKFGHFGMSEKHAFENLVTMLPDLIKLIPRDWNNVQTIGIKSDLSVFLPIYSSSLS